MTTRSPLALTEELLLLAAHDEKGSLRNSTMLGYGLAGAALLELANLGVLRINDGFAEIAPGGPIEDPLLREIHDLLAGARRRRKLKDWIRAIPNKVKKLPHRVADRLVERGILRRVTGKTLGIFPYTRFPEADPRPEREILDRLRRAVAGSRKLDPRTGTLLAMVGATGLTSVVFDKPRRKDARARIREITERDLYGGAVSATIREVQASVVAVMAATSAASTAATT